MLSKIFNAHINVEYYNSIKSNQESIAGISSETLSKPFKLEWSWRKICTVSKWPQIHFKCTICPHKTFTSHSKMHFAVFDNWGDIHCKCSITFPLFAQAVIVCPFSCSSLLWAWFVVCTLYTPFIRLSVKTAGHACTASQTFKPYV